MNDFLDGKKAIRVYTQLQHKHLYSVFGLNYEGKPEDYPKRYTIEGHKTIVETMELPTVDFKELFTGEPTKIYDSVGNRLYDGDGVLIIGKQDGITYGCRPVTLKGNFIFCDMPYDVFKFAYIKNSRCPK